MFVFGLIFLIFLFSHSKCSQEPIQFDVSKDISDTKVTVYSTLGATLERKFEKEDIFSKELDELNDEVDNQEIVFLGIEDCTDLSSVSFKGYAITNEDNNQEEEKKSFIIQGLVVKEQENDDEIGTLKQKIKELEKEKEVKKQERENSNKILALFDTAVTKSTEEYSLFKKAMVDYLEERGKLQGKISEITEEINFIDSKIRKLQDDIRGLKIIKYDIYVTAKIPKNGKKYIFIISYNHFSAVWEPSYTLRIESSLGKGYLEYYANIKQWSGYDWNNADIYLSDTDLNNYHEAPKIRPVKISTTDNSKIFSGRRGKYSNVKNTYIGQDQSNILRRTVNQYENINEEKLQFSDEMEFTPFRHSDNIRTEISDFTVFHLSERKNVISEKNQFSSGSIKVLLMDSFEIESKFVHYIIPQQSKETYVKMIGKHKKEFTLLPGSLTLIVDDQFISKNKFESPIHMNGKFELWTGSDNFVSFKKIPIKTKNENTGIFSKKKSEIKTIELSVENKKNLKTNVSVIHSLPYPQNEEVEIHLFEPFNMKLNDIYSNKNILESLKKNEMFENVIFDEEGSLILYPSEKNKKKTNTEFYKIRKDFIFERNLSLDAGKIKTDKVKYAIVTKRGTEYFINYDL